MKPFILSNRRVSSRSPVSIAVKLTMGRRATLSQAANISTDGILLACVYDTLLPTGHRCRLEFALPGTSGTIQATGVVVRQQRHRRYHLLAIRFSVLAPSHRRGIMAYTEGVPHSPEAPPIFLPLKRLPAPQHQLASVA